MVPVSVLYGIAGPIELGPITSTFSWETVLTAYVLYLYGHISITTGIHRFFTHGAFQAKRWLQWFWLVGFSAVFQAPALWWVGKHTRHHADADTPGDPHYIDRGFFWAHMGWLFFKQSIHPEDNKYVKHLAKVKEDPRRLRRVSWQRDHYWKLAVVVGLVLPTAVCWVGWGDPIGGLLIGGFSRLVYQYHTTWLANSQAHCLGRRRNGGGSATAHRWIGLFFNVGESTDHAYHHAVQHDWRIEPKASWFNPGTWFLCVCSKLGWVWNLREGTSGQIKRARFVTDATQTA